MKHLYILGDSRSGSTILQKIIKDEIGGINVGEIRRLFRPTWESVPCACGSSLGECLYWLGVLSGLGSNLELKSQQESTSLYRHIKEVLQLTSWITKTSPIVSKFFPDSAASGVMALSKYVASEYNEGLIIDSSKNSAHFVSLQYMYGKNIYPIFLTRDGRGVVWSKHRRKNVSIEKATKDWLSCMQHMKFISKFVGDNALWVSYEELCEKPGQVVEKIGSLLGTTQTNENAFGHEIGGSPNLKGKTEWKVELDARWEKEMLSEDLSVFDEIAGNINRSLGY